MTTQGTISQSELLDQQTHTLDLMMRSFRRSLWTGMPAVVVSYNPAQNTAVVRLAIADFWRHLDGSVEWAQVPDLPDVPVQWPRGGGLTMTFPLSPGDEGVVVFANRCFDTWWDNGMQPGMLPQNEAGFRHNELSDGMFIPGINCRTNTPANISTTSTQIRQVNGPNLIELTQSGAVNVTCTNATVQATGNANVMAGSQANITAPTIVLDGEVTVEGDLTATGVITAEGGFATT